MKRSKWKNLLLPTEPLKKLKAKLKRFKKEHNDTKALASKHRKSPQNVKISRYITIIPTYIGSTFEVHSGKSFKKVIVLKEMVGHKFGEFCPTRSKFEFKKKKRKKK